MFKQFFKDSAIYGLSTILVRGLSLILLPFYTRVLSPTDYGTVDILTIFITLVNLTIALEISQAVARYFTEAQTYADKIAYASTALWFTVGVYTLFVAFAFLMAAPLSQLILNSSTQAPIFQVAMLSLWGNGLFYLAQNQLRWQLQPMAYAIASLVSSLTLIGMSIVFVLIFRLGVIGVIYGQLAGAIIGAALTFYFARHSYSFVFSWAKCQEMLRFSAPLVPSSIGVFVTLYIDRIALKELMSIADVGLFGIGYRLASVASLLLLGVQGALTPLVYTYYREPNTPFEIARIFRYFVAAALLTFLGLSLFSYELLVMFATPEYYAATVVVPLLVPAILLSGMYIFGPGLGIAKKTGAIALINIIGAVLNTGLNFTLIPVLGISGAALATLLSSITVFAAYVIYSQKLYFIPHAWLRLAMALMLTSGVFLGGAQLHLIWWMNIIVKLSLIGFAAGVFVWLGLVETTAIKGIWQRLSRWQVIARA